MKINNAKGFTIIELLIATAVFSTILLLASNAVVQIGRLYYKGLTSTLTQEAARATSEDVSRAIQLGNRGDVNRSDDAGKDFDDPKAVCIGDTRYTYAINRQIGGSTGGPHALWVDQAPDGGCPTVDLNIPTPSADGRELLGPNMRLLNFEINDISPLSVYNVKVVVGYGDNELLTHYNQQGELVDLSGDGAIDQNDSGMAQCELGGIGSNFCAISALDTVVKRRIN